MAGVKRVQSTALGDKGLYFRGRTLQKPSPDEKKKEKKAIKKQYINPKK